MNLVYKKATIEDIEVLTETRIEVLRAANKLSDDTNMDEVRKQSYDYYKKALSDGTHIAYLIFDENQIVGTGRGIAYKTLDKLIKDVKSKGITAISLEATDMGRPLYEKYGFVKMNNEMELPQ